MQIEFHGADREVTGSCHIVRAAGRTVMLDCGLFQGHRQECDEKNRRLPVPVGELDAVVVSHAHLDHIGRLPYLVASGYRRPIFATPATRDLAAIMLADSAHIQESDAAHLARHGRPCIGPLYTRPDVAPVLELMRSIPYEQWFDVVPGVRARYTDAGHILGSASITLVSTAEGASRKLVFSGDIGRTGLPIIRDPVPPHDGADLVLMESTYGSRDHESVADARDRLGRVVRETAARGGRVLVPAFAVGRAQELVYDLHALHRAGLIPAIPIILDSPLATDATTVFEMHPELFDRTEEFVRAESNLFQFELLTYTRNVEESKQLNTALVPMVIIAGSGMAESGRILHHLKFGAPDPRNTVLIVGFQAEHTLGRRIVEHRPMLKIFGEEVPLRAHVEVLNGYSAHADRHGLVQWLNTVRANVPQLKRVCLVHGEASAQDSLATDLRAQGYEVQAPEFGQQVEV